jgi:hypothetical protein
MGRRALGLALLTLALVVPASANAADPYKVLAVTSTEDPLRTAGLAALTAAGAGGVFTVTAPAPAATTIGQSELCRG